jgi:methyl-accepting chemotaxis protein
MTLPGWVRWVLILSVRRRIFGGFAVVLLLLAGVAAVALRSMESVASQAGFVGSVSAQARATTDVAMKVVAAHGAVVQYALSATLDDQHLAQAALAAFDQALETGRSVVDDNNGQLAAMATAYRASVDATITAVQSRRAAVEQLTAAGVDLRTIVSATAARIAIDTEPAVSLAVTRMVGSFGAADAGAARLVASRTPADANTATGAMQTLRGDVEAVRTAAAGNARLLRLLKGVAEPLDRLAEGVQLVVAADDRLRVATGRRDAASAAVLAAAMAQRMNAVQAQTGAISSTAGVAQQAYRIEVAASLAALAAGLLLAILIGHSLSRPLTQLTRVMRTLTGGDLSADVPHTKRRDELGEMARAVLVFRHSMERESQLTAAQAEERLAAEAAKQAALVQMADRIEAEMGVALEHIGVRTTAMITTADALNASAERTGSSSGEAAHAAEGALSNAQMVASAAEQLTASIAEIGTQVSGSAAVVGRAVTAGTETRSVIEALNQEVEQIGGFARLIGEIAARTNLLALNATIEAARAGEAGKGFAVVASEVKALASQTARSTEEISRHIGLVQAATTESMEAVSRIEQTIMQVDAIAGSIAAAVHEQGAATEEIARTVHQSAFSANEMTSVINDVAREAVETGHHAVDVRQNTLALHRAVEELRSSVVRSIRNAITAGERRQHPRIAVSIPGRISDAAGTTHAVQLLDLSESGARVDGPTGFAVGSPLVLAVEGIAAPLPSEVRATGDGTLHLIFRAGEAATREVRALLERVSHRQAA